VSAQYHEEYTTQEGRMKTKGFVGLCLSVLVTVIAPSVARADDVDDKQKAVSTEITIAEQTKQLSAKDAKELRRAMSEFEVKKKRLREANSDVLSVDDEKKLIAQLNAIENTIEKKKKGSEK